MDLNFINWEEEIKKAGPAKAIAIWVLVGICGFLGAFISCVVIFVTCPIWIPLNNILKKMGRKGFVHVEGIGVGSSMTISLSVAAFQKRV